MDDKEGLKLDTPAYNALIHAQTKQNGSISIAEQLLNHMLQNDGPTKIRPVSVLTFLNCISICVTYISFLSSRMLLRSIQCWMQ